MTPVEYAESHRNKWDSIINAELTRVEAIVLAGNPPPVSYSVGGKSFQWDDWHRMAEEQRNKWQERVLALGGDGGFGEGTIRGYT